jgi:antitoxin component YwqK of YwqJK toxin-antitoxin module
MKPHLRPLFLLLLASCIACSGTEQVEEKDPALGTILTFTVNKETGLKDGPYTKTDSTGVLMEKGFMKAGQQEGFRELYYPDGQVKIRERYKAGALDDLYEYFFPNGQVELKGYYVQGAMYGLWLKYMSTGQLLEEVTMINNEEMGPFREYHPNGRLQAEGAYLNGPNEHGRLRLYDEQGQLQKEMDCRNGRCYTLWEKE